jgi:uncharacterized membrane protein
MNDEFNVENMEPAGKPDATDDDRLWVLLAYVLTPLMPIVIMLLEDKKNRPFIKAHNGQALVWGVVSIVGGGILSAVLPFLCGLPGLVFWLVSIYWGWQAYQGKTVEIPVISDFVRNQGWA